jgi:hypothetical protein
LTLGLLLGTEWLHPGPEQWNSLDLTKWRLVLL